jgi:hypothetical protein
MPNPILLLACFTATAVPASSNDNGRYLVQTVSHCQHPVDVVLRLRFTLIDGSTVEDWDSLRFVQPGPRSLQLAYPAKARGFRKVEIAVEEMK